MLNLPCCCLSAKHAPCSPLALGASVPSMHHVPCGCFSAKHAPPALPLEHAAVSSVQLALLLPHCHLPCCCLTANHALTALRLPHRQPCSSCPAAASLPTMFKLPCGCLTANHTQTALRLPQCMLNLPCRCLNAVACSTCPAAASVPRTCTGCPAAASVPHSMHQQGNLRVVGVVGTPHSMQHLPQDNTCTCTAAQHTVNARHAPRQLPGW